MFLLGVPSSTSSKFASAYAEMGRKPLMDFWWQQCMKYLQRLHHMQATRLPKIAFAEACRQNLPWIRGLRMHCKGLGLASCVESLPFDCEASSMAMSTKYQV